MADLDLRPTSELTDEEWQAKRDRVAEDLRNHRQIDEAGAADPAQERQERIDEIAGRLFAEGMDQEQADRRARAILRAEELAPEQLESVRIEKLVRTWFLSGLFTFGLAIIAAKKGNWKSHFALQAAYALSIGRAFLGRDVPAPVSVLYLALELDRIAMSERAQRIGEAPANLDILFSFARGDKAVSDIEALILARGYRVVFVDMAAAILPAGTETNVYEQIVEFLLKLRRLAQRLEACVVLLLHSPKAEKADFADAVLGSVGFGGQADSIIFLDRKRGERVAQVYSTGNHGEDTTFRISMNENLGLELLDDGEELSFLPREEQSVLTALESFPDGAGPTAIANQLGRTTEREIAAVRSTLLRLKDKGKVVKSGRGNYEAVRQIPDESIDDEIENELPL